MSIHTKDLGWLYHQDGPSFQNPELMIQYLTKSLEADQSAQSWYLSHAYMMGQKYNKMKNINRLTIFQPEIYLKYPQVSLCSMPAALYDNVTGGFPIWGLYKISTLTTHGVLADTIYITGAYSNAIIIKVPVTSANIRPGFDVVRLSLPISDAHYQIWPSFD
ncbi:hypothetical protein HD554DRAFT_2041172 [Boletus coccyginus]|nr:hypothetical protein HD554DRAFT_2041172 [Boletus coccyginus]